MRPRRRARVPLSASDMLAEEPLSPLTGRTKQLDAGARIAAEQASRSHSEVKTLQFPRFFKRNPLFGQELSHTNVCNSRPLLHRRAREADDPPDAPRRATRRR